MPDVKHFDVDAVLDDVMRLFWWRVPATTGIQAVVAATGVSRSSLEATFGGKHSLYVAALRRYVERCSAPVFARLVSSTSGLGAIEEFFAADPTALHGPVRGLGVLGHQCTRQPEFPAAGA